MSDPERIRKLARSFAADWLRPDNPDAATPALLDTLQTTMLAFYACASRVKPDVDRHPWTPDETKNRCTVCGDGPWGRHRFQCQACAEWCADNEIGMTSNRCECTCHSQERTTP